MCDSLELLIYTDLILTLARLIALVIRICKTPRHDLFVVQAITELP